MIPINYWFYGFTSLLLKTQDSTYIGLKHMKEFQKIITGSYHKILKLTPIN